MKRQEILARVSQPAQERRIMAAWERFLQSGEVAPNTVRSRGWASPAWAIRRTQLRWPPAGPPGE
jgi:hypothetical protein